MRRPVHPLRPTGQTAAAAAALVAEDCALEFPSLGPQVRAAGRAAIESVIGGLLKNVPGFRSRLNSLLAASS